MMSIASVRRLSPRAMLMTSTGLMFASAFLLWLHSATVRDMREIGLPAAVEIPRIEQRMEILREQNEVAQLQAALRGGSQEELMRVYALPAEADADRLLATFDVLFSYLEQTGDLSWFSAVSMGEMAEHDELTALPMTFEAVLTPTGVTELELFLRLSGFMTISDALGADGIAALLDLSERENPASVAALEHFLSTDLLRYSEDPRPYEEQLRRSFSPAAEDVLRTAFDSTDLRNARTLFGNLAPVLRSQELWPLRMLTLKGASYETRADGDIQATYEIEAWSRK